MLRRVASVSLLPGDKLIQKTRVVGKKAVHQVLVMLHEVEKSLEDRVL